VRRYPQPEVSSHIRKLPDRELASRRLVPKAGAVSAGPTGSLEPRSETHYRLQLNTPERVKAKLEMARDLMSHANPSGDLVVVIERGLDLLIAQLQKARFGQTSRPRKSRTACPRQPATLDASGASTLVHLDAAVQPHDPSNQGDGKDFDRSKSSPRGRAHDDFDRSRSCGSAHDDFDRSKSGPRRVARKSIPRETLRRLVERDGPCCSFVGEDGTRCTSRAFLEVDHRRPRAIGGPDTLENLRWLCRAHNQLGAEQDFGKPHVQRAIAERRLRQATAAPPTSHDA
jgi:hypothetical protein